LSACFYFDASVQVKYYVREPGSAWVRRIVDDLDPDTGQRANLLFTATISLAEVAAAFSLLARGGRITERIRDRVFDRYIKSVVTDYHLIPVTLDIVNAAAHLTQRHALRGYDAVQLAAGLSLNALLCSEAIAITYVSGDEILLNAARSEGLAIENPFWHADLDGIG